MPPACLQLNTSITDAVEDERLEDLQMLSYYAPKVPLLLVCAERQVVTETNEHPCNHAERLTTNRCRSLATGMN